jgi:hypothetical protein
MHNYELWNLRYQLDSCDDVDYQGAVVQITASLIRFLQDHNLIIKIIPNNWRESQNLQIYESDLTEEGVAVMRDALLKWLRFADRDAKNRSNVTILEKSLNKVRKLS